MSLVALLCIFLKHIYVIPEICTPCLYSKLGLTIALYRGTVQSNYYLYMLYFSESFQEPGYS